MKRIPPTAKHTVIKIQIAQLIQLGYSCLFTPSCTLIRVSCSSIWRSMILCKRNLDCRWSCMRNINQKFLYDDRQNI